MAHTFDDDHTVRTPRAFAWSDGSGDYAAIVTPGFAGFALTLSYVTGGESWQYVGRRWVEGDTRPDAAAYVLSKGFAMCEDGPYQSAGIVWLEGAAYLLDDVTDY